VSTFEELSTRLNEVKADMKKIALERGSELVAELLKPLFDLGVVQATWTQYTPYFNDGEPCEFGMGEFNFSFSEEELDGYPDDEDGWFYGSDLTTAFADFQAPQSYSWRTYTVDDINKMKAEHEERRANLLSLGIRPDSVKAIADAAETAYDLMTKNEELMEMIFGNHVRVTATIDGIRTDEYDHD